MPGTRGLGDSGRAEGQATVGQGRRPNKSSVTHGDRPASRPQTAAPQLLLHDSQLLEDTGHTAQNSQSLAKLFQFRPTSEILRDRFWFLQAQPQ